MIKYLSFESHVPDIRASYVTSVKLYNIESEAMTDDFIPYRFQSVAQLWLGEGGHFGEIECWRVLTEEEQCKYAHEVERVDGAPLLQIISCDNQVLVQQLENRYIIWLESGLLIDREFHCNTIRFLFSEDVLVAIAADIVTVAVD